MIFVGYMIGRAITVTARLDSRKLEHPLALQLTTRYLAHAAGVMHGSIWFWLATHVTTRRVT